MDPIPETGSTSDAPKPAPAIKIFGVGTGGIHIMEHLKQLPGVTFVALGADAKSLETSFAAEKVHLETGPLRGLGTGGDPERGRALAEEHAAKLKALCEGAGAVFIVAGLGGGAGTGISPVLARVAREAGALVLAFVVLPFDCEGNQRQRLALAGLDDLKAAADGTVCLPNQKIFQLIDENTSVVDTFRTANELLADAVRGVWRLLANPGLIQIHFSDVCTLLRGRHSESAFAVADAMGATRAREVMDKLMAHPMLEGGQVLTGSDAVLVSLTGGRDLTMADVNRVMAEINTRCQRATVLMGAAIDDNFAERLSVILIAARKTGAEETARRLPQAGAEPLGAQLLERATTARPGSRYVPPPPALPQDEMEKLMARQGRGTGRGRKTRVKMRQGQLPLEIISKGRFDKSEPTIHRGEDLDVPTYIRRGVSLN